METPKVKYIRWLPGEIMEPIPEPRTFSALVECNECSSKTVINCEIEYDVNAMTIDDNMCSNCGHEFTDKELDNLEEIV